LRRRAEDEAMQDALSLPKDRNAFTLQVARELLHELKVHQIELEMQNEELRRTQEELMQSHQRYHELYENAPVGYVTLNDQGVMQELNLTTVDLLGRDRHRLLDRPFVRFVHPDDVDLYIKGWMQCSRIGGDINLELRLQTGEEWVWVRLEMMHREGPSGDDSYNLVLHNAQELKEAGESLDEMCDMLKSAQSLAKMGSFELITDDDRMIWSPETFALFHLDPEDGTPDLEQFLHFLHKDDRILLEQAFTVAQATGEFDLEFRVILPNEEAMYLHGVGQYIEADDRRPARLRGMMQDITDRKVDQETLLESEQRYKALFDTIPVGVLVVDSEGYLMDVNELAAKQLGIDRVEGLGANLLTGPWQLFNEDGSVMPHEQYPLVRAIRSNRAVRNERVKAMRPDGSFARLKVTAVPISHEGYGALAVYETLPD
ncbi:PAS domain-containing protein, partial [bacterium]|nr:PAS domain-containing protein [bacterium]